MNENLAVLIFLLSSLPPSHTLFCLHFFLRSRRWFHPMGWEDLLEEGMATPSSILAWRIPWTEEPGGLQSMESQRVGHDWAHTQTHRHTPSINSRDLFSHCSGGWESKIMALPRLTPASSLPGLRMAAFLLSLHAAFPLCPCIRGVAFSFSKAISPIGFGPYPMPSFNLN